MYAVIKTGGKQYRVESGDEVKVEKLNGEVGDTVTFKDVLLISDQESFRLGKPFIEDSKVIGRITRHAKDKKVLVFKYKKRQNYKRKRGHRQQFTLVRIENIET